jgi:hypothetical protein
MLEHMGFVAENAENDERFRLTVSVPANFTPTQLEVLKRTVEAKAPLIKKALGIGALPIVNDGEQLSFPWFTPCEAEDYNAYAQFIGALVTTCKTKTRVQSKPQDEFANERFTMQTFMVALGMAGPEYAAARRLMRRNLTGHVAFRNNDSKERWYAKHRNRKAAKYTAYCGEDEGVVFKTLTAAKAYVDERGEGYITDSLGKIKYNKGGNAQ